jgi:hypothetical protein
MGLLVEFLFEVVLRPIFEFVLCLIGYHTGKLLVRVLSLGRLHVDPWLAERPDKPKWWSPLTYKRGRRRYLDVEAVAVIGIFFWVILVVIFVVVRCL